MSVGHPQVPAPHAAGPVARRAGVRLPDRWARHPVVVAEQAVERWEVSHVWHDDEALLVRLPWRERPHGGGPYVVEQDRAGASLLGLGTAVAAARLLRRVLGAGELPGPVVRTSLPRGTHAALAACAPAGPVPAPFGLVPDDLWDWYALTRPPVVQAGEARVVELVGEPGRRAAAQCLARANPGGELLVTEPRSRWWGWRDDDGEVRGVAGASRRVPGRPWVLGSIGTDPDRRGRGIGAAVTAAAARAGLGEASSVALGVYAANDGARRVYERLGFVLGQEFESLRA